jgi:hypothetical protein
MAPTSTSASTLGANMPSQLRTEGLGVTERKDAWWNENTFTLTALVVFGIYGMWAAAQGAHYEAGPYLSPFYSPQLAKMFPGLFSWVSFSPAFLVLWAPLGFRGTCYFYRRAVYRAAFNSPPQCGVDVASTQPLGKYRGEQVFPFVIMNLHRYFLYAALVLTVFHWYHLYEALFYQGKVGIGVGTLVLGLDTLFLTLYVGSCHSLRHLLGGKLNNFVENLFSRLRFNLWKEQSVLNTRHWLYAWVSLFTVGFADLYIRLVSMGIWQDFNTWGASFSALSSTAPLGLS